MNKTSKKVPVETEEQRKNREMIETIAGNIASLSKAVAALLNGPLKRRAIIILIANTSGVSQEKVTEVLKALESMEKDWLN